MPTDPKAVRAMVDRVVALPTLPSVVKQLCTMVEGETTSAEEVGRMISTDQVLSARVLRLVNSAYYGFPGRISTVTHALVLLGFNVVKGLVLSAAVIDIMQEGIVGLWEHSCGCSLISGLLARRIDLPDPEEVTVAALLHDLGKVILGVEMSREFQEIQAHQRMARVSLREAEEHVLGGLNHADVAAWLAEDWRLPLRLIDPIRHHHRPTVSEHAPRQAAIVNLADILTRALGFGFGGDPYVPPLDPKVMAVLGLSWEELDEFIATLPAELEELDTSVFEG
jgi:putative nucleotidyltransferase with HDIG domain